MCTLTFMKAVISGNKKLMKMSQVVAIPDIPQIKEINTSVIWEDIETDSVISEYFPDIFIETARTPDRTYMFNVFSKDIRGIATKTL